MTWAGYALIELTTALSGPQKVAMRNALLGLGAQIAPQPVDITHLRPRLDNQAAIFAATVELPYNKGQFVTALASGMNISASTLNSWVAVTNFSGSDWEARRQAVCDYLLANAAAWGENAA